MKVSKMLGRQNRACSWGCCKDIVPHRKAVRVLKRRERQNWKRDLMRGTL